MRKRKEVKKKKWKNWLDRIDRIDRLYILRHYIYTFTNDEKKKGNVKEFSPKKRKTIFKKKDDDEKEASFFPIWEKGQLDEKKTIF